MPRTSMVGLSILPSGRNTGTGGVLARATEQALLSFISGQIPHDYRNYRVADLLSQWRTKTRLYLLGGNSPGKRNFGN